jgi:hypothetical protein
MSADVRVARGGPSIAEALVTVVSVLALLQAATVWRAPAAAAVVPGPAVAPRGYWLVAADGAVRTYGAAGFYGSMGGNGLRRPIVGMAPTASGHGYWEVAADGGIFTFGDASFAGSAGGLPLVQPVVGMAATATGGGYWLVASDGGMFSYGDATFFGSMGGRPLNRPIIAMSPTPSGRGYWLVASDGGIFSFGDARFYGSTGSIRLNRPIVGMAPTPSGRGYWLVASDGGIFSYGDARFAGSTGAIALKAPITGMAASPSGRGYWLVASDGGIFAFGDAEFAGSAGGGGAPSPTVGMAAVHASHSTEVIAYYYPWWGNPQYDGAWSHWNQNGASPPDAIASNYLPVRGAYSESDQAVLDGQFAEIAAAGIDEVVVSWWGQDSYEDHRLPAVTSAAAAHNVRVGIHIEDYPNRTAATVESDLAYLKARGYSDFWVYFANMMPADQLRGVLDRAGPIRVMASSTDIASVEAGGFEDWALSAGFSGIYTYDPYFFNAPDFPGICGAARMRGLLCSPGVAPGFLGTRATNITRVKPRNNGATYDERWQGAIASGADIAGVVSYNEWHEGSQIEPAVASGCASDPSCYSDFEGAYGKTGVDAQRAYLDRTALWTSRYRPTGG